MNYYYVYWVIQALSILIGTAVLIELVQRITGRTKTAQRWNIAMFGWGALAVVAVIAMRPLTSFVDNVTNVILAVDRTVRLAQFALAFFMVMFGTPVGISKRNLLFGITIGFGFYAVVNLVVMAFFSHTSFLSKRSLSRVDSVAYVISMLIWLAHVAAAAKDDGHRSLPTIALHDGL